MKSVLAISGVVGAAASCTVADIVTMQEMNKAPTSTASVEWYTANAACTTCMQGLVTAGTADQANLCVTDKSTLTCTADQANQVQLLGLADLASGGSTGQDYLALPANYACSLCIVEKGGADVVGDDAIKSQTAGAAGLTACTPAGATGTTAMTDIVSATNDALAGLTGASNDAVNNLLSAAGLTTEAAGSSCFSGDARVETINGFKSMSALETGDVVRTASGFEPVVGFLHAEEAKAMFYELTTSAGVLPVTGDHMVFMSNGESVLASSVQVGDELSSGTVTSVQQTMREGIYSPLTKSGTIVVEGTTASTYAVVNHSLSHLAVAPMRFTGLFTASRTSLAPVAFPISA